MKRTTPNITPFTNYFGSKSGSGVYQSIINHIPPHRIFMTLFAGNCGIFKYMRRAELTIINDVDKDIFTAWNNVGFRENDNIIIENKDAIEFLRHDINKPEYAHLLKYIVIYLDPPYLRKTRKGQSNIYKHELTEECQHIELLETVLNLPKEIKIIISHYPCELYNEMLKEWQTFDFKAMTRSGIADERIYMNYQLDGHLHDYSYIGQNFRVREKYKRIITNFFLKLDRMEPILRNSMLQEYDLDHRNKIR